MLKQDNPMVSVILPVHNCADTVSCAIDSIRNQTFTDWELIIVDDKSTDGTPELLEEKARLDERIRLFRFEVNQGIACALNFAWQQARGEFVARMDADDFSLPERLALQVDFMSQHGEVDVLGTGVFFDSQDENARQCLKPETHEQLVKDMNLRVPFFHPTVMFRKAFLERCGGYNPAWRRHQDLELWWRTYRNSRFANLPKPLLVYRLPPPKGFRKELVQMKCDVLVRWRDGKRIQALGLLLFSLGYNFLIRTGLWRPRSLRFAHEK